MKLNKTINWIGMFIGIILIIESFLLIKWLYPFTLFIGVAGAIIFALNLCKIKEDNLL